MNYQQLRLFDLPPTIKAIHDPYWDELEATTDDIVNSSQTTAIDESEILGTSIKFAHQHNESVGEQLPFNGSQYNSVGEQVKQDTKKIAHQHDVKIHSRDTEATHWVEKYWVERVGNKYWYYRYTWMEGRKLRRHYLGSVRSPKANLKKQAVEEAILDGQLTDDIIQMLRGWN